MSDAPTAASGPDRLDLALPVAALVLTTLALAGTSTGAGDTPIGWVGWLLPVALTAPLLVRRRRPVAVAVVSVLVLIAYYVSGRPAIGFELLVAPALFSAAEQGRLRAAAWVAAGAIAFTYFARIAFLGQDALHLLSVQFVTTVAVMLGACAAGDALHSRRLRRVEEAERRRLLLAHAEQEARELVESERRALARDIHDVLGHTLVVAGQQASVADEAVAADRVNDARTALTVLRTHVKDARRELSDSLRLLRGDDPEGRMPTAGLADVARLTESFRAAGLHVDVVTEGELGGLSTAVDSTAYRVLQEALTNVVKHSGSPRASVRITRSPRQLELEVTDAGEQREPWTWGTGTTGMRERVALLGGQIDAGATERGGRVCVTLPLVGGAGR